MSDISSSSSSGQTRYKCGGCLPWRKLARVYCATGVVLAVRLVDRGTDFWTLNLLTLCHQLILIIIIIIIIIIILVRSIITRWT